MYVNTPVRQQPNRKANICTRVISNIISAIEDTGLTFLKYPNWMPNVFNGTAAFQEGYIEYCCF